LYLFFSVAAWPAVQLNQDILLFLPSTSIGGGAHLLLDDGFGAGLSGAGGSSGSERMGMDFDVARTTADAIRHEIQVGACQLPTANCQLPLKCNEMLLGCHALLQKNVLFSCICLFIIYFS
jgi:hypothetical protein